MQEKSNDKIDSFKPDLINEGFNGEELAERIRKIQKVQEKRLSRPVIESG